MTPTTPQHDRDELREQLKYVLSDGKPSPHQVIITKLSDEALDKILQLIAAHDQQLLEAILEGQREYYSPALRVDAVPVEHIKSVFGKEGE